MAEENNVEDQVQEPDWSEMSDEDFANFNLPEDNDSEEIEESDTNEEAEIEESTSEESTEASEEVTETDTDNESTSTSEIDVDAATAMYAALTAPMKVGGTEITINSPEEAVTLIQRGLGANKRMQELQPQLKTISMLEANGLMDKDKLNFLIELDKGNPEAIKKLIGSSGVDAFDLSTGEAQDDYSPNDYSVTDSEYALEEVFRDISTTDSYNDTLETIKGFDAKSKSLIQEEPTLIPQLNAHVADGTFTEISKIIQKDRMLGNLTGLSDLEAYKHVWNTVQEHLASNPGMGEAGHKNETNGQNGKEYLAGTEGTQEAGHNSNDDRQVGNAQSRAKAAAESTNRNRGSQTDTVIDFDKMTDDQILNLEYSDIFKD